MSRNRIDSRPIPPPDVETDNRPKLPALRTFIIRRESILVDPRLPDVMLHAHGYDTEEGVARFFVFAVEMRDEQQGPIIVQYICRSFKEWTDIEEVYQSSSVAH